MSFSRVSARIAVSLRWYAIAAVAIVSALPFLFVCIPPLTDVPGHIGRFAVQVAPPDSGLWRYFGFVWQLKLNLAVDLLVQALHPLLDPFATMWLACIAVPVLTVIGLMALTRRINPQGAAALPWALIFVYNSPFLWGFVNYSLSAALALCGFALWPRWEQRPWLRGIVFALLIPALFVGHAEGGALLFVWVASYEFGEARAWRPSTWHRATAGRLIARLWPLAFAVLPILLSHEGGGGITDWSVPQKFDELIGMVRDQNAVLDIATAALALLVLILGWRLGARLAPGAFWPVMATLLLFLVAPRQLSGSNNVDMRIAPYVFLLALALQDWSPVARARRLQVVWAGITLLAVRFGLTTASFIDYAADYRRELAALDHVAPGSRVLNLVRDGCGIGDWRQSRTTHLGNLATPLRGAWVNAHWAVPSLHLLRIRYAPPVFARDPSQLISPQRCIKKVISERTRRTMAEQLPLLPLDQADYLWLIDVRLPPNVHQPRLALLWQSGDSALYAIRPPETTSGKAPK